MIVLHQEYGKLREVRSDISYEVKEGRGDSPLDPKLSDLINL